MVIFKNNIQNVGHKQNNTEHIQLNISIRFQTCFIEDAMRRRRHRPRITGSTGCDLFYESWWVNVTRWARTVVDLYGSWQVFGCYWQCLLVLGWFLAGCLADSVILQCIWRFWRIPEFNARSSRSGARSHWKSLMRPGRVQQSSKCATWRAWNRHVPQMPPETPRDRFEFEQMFSKSFINVCMDFRCNPSAQARVPPPRLL